MLSPRGLTPPFDLVVPSTPLLLAVAVEAAGLARLAVAGASAAAVFAAGRFPPLALDDEEAARLETARGIRETAERRVCCGCGCV